MEASVRLRVAEAVLQPRGLVPDPDVTGTHSVTRHQWLMRIPMKNTTNSSGWFAVYRPASTSIGELLQTTIGEVPTAGP